MFTKVNLRTGEKITRPGAVPAEKYIRFCVSACALANAKRGKVTVCWDSVSIRIYTGDHLFIHKSPLPFAAR